MGAPKLDLVIPAKAGIQACMHLGKRKLDSRLRGNDGYLKVSK
jgi:hypothetical protein